jgi:hypothetical protein
VLLRLRRAAQPQYQKARRLIDREVVQGKPVCDAFAKLTISIPATSRWSGVSAAVSVAPDDVFGRLVRFRETERMVVRDDHGGGIVLQSTLDDFARVLALAERRSGASVL